MQPVYLGNGSKGDGLKNLESDTIVRQHSMVMLVTFVHKQAYLAACPRYPAVNEPAYLTSSDEVYPWSDCTCDWSLHAHLYELIICTVFESLVQRGLEGLLQNCCLVLGRTASHTKN